MATLIKIVQTLQDNAAAFGIVGGIVLVWTSLSLFSVLESALNIVYGRPNRGFLAGKSLALAFMVGTLAVLFFGLIVASVGDSMLKRYVPGVTDNGVAAYVISVLISGVAVFLFLASIYRLLPNVPDMTLREVLPGAIAATVLLEVTFQILPLYIRFSSLNPTLRAFSGGVLLLVWLYVMANVIVMGAEVNWWASRREVGDRGAAGLDVLPRDVVDAADWWPAAERAVWSAFVVVAEPVCQCLCAVVAGAVGLAEGPLAFEGLLVALNLAVDLGAADRDAADDGCRFARAVHRVSGCLR